MNLIGVHWHGDDRTRRIEGGVFRRYELISKMLKLNKSTDYTSTTELNNRYLNRPIPFQFKKNVEDD
jgi:hypothetical protein